MVTFIQPFDFFTILVGYFLGNQELFIFAFIIIFSLVSAKYQMSDRVFLILLTIGSILFGAHLGEAEYFLILFIVGLITFRMVADIVT